MGFMFVFVSFVTKKPTHTPLMLLANARDPLVQEEKNAKHKNVWSGDEVYPTINSTISQFIKFD